MANKLRMETEFDESAKGDNLDIIEEKEESDKDPEMNTEKSDNSKSETEFDEGPLLVVEKILKSWMRVGQKEIKEYLLKWKGFSVGRGYLGKYNRI